MEDQQRGGGRERERAGFHNHISMEVFSKPIASTLSRRPASPANRAAALGSSANRSALCAPSECLPPAKARETRLVLPRPRGPASGEGRFFPLRFFRALYSNIVVTTRRENIYRRGDRPATARPRVPPRRSRLPRLARRRRRPSVSVARQKRRNRLSNRVSERSGQGPNRKKAGSHSASQSL